MLTADGYFGEDRAPRVLDLYAGSGALGLEALSRGAGAVVFVEHARPALTAIRDNVRALGVHEQVTVVPLKVDRALASVEGPFDVTFADPPYADVRALGFGEILAKVATQVTREGGILVLEHASNDEPPAPPGLVLDRRRRYGDTTLSLFISEAAGEAPSTDTSKEDGAK